MLKVKRPTEKKTRKAEVKLVKFEVEYELSIILTTSCFLDFICI